MPQYRRSENDAQKSADGKNNFTLTSMITDSDILSVLRALLATPPRQCNSPLKMNYWIRKKNSTGIGPLSTVHTDRRFSSRSPQVFEIAMVVWPGARPHTSRAARRHEDSGVRSAGVSYNSKTCQLQRVLAARGRKRLLALVRLGLAFKKKLTLLRRSGVAVARAAMHGDSTSNEFSFRAKLKQVKLCAGLDSGARKAGRHASTIIIVSGLRRPKKIKQKKKDPKQNLTARGL